MIEKTLVLLKPDAVQRQIMGKVITRFEDAGLKFVAMKMKWVDPEFSKKHYSAHTEKPFYPGLEKMITEGPVLALVIEGLHAVELVRKIVGPTEPKSASPGTIRGDLAMSVSNNVIHCSDSLDNAKIEVERFFNKEDLFDYDKSEWAHVYALDEING